MHNDESASSVVAGLMEFWLHEWIECLEEGVIEECNYTPFHSSIASFTSGSQQALIKNNIANDFSITHFVSSNSNVRDRKETDTRSVNK